MSSLMGQKPTQSFCTEDKISQINNNFPLQAGHKEYYF